MKRFKSDLSRDEESQLDFLTQLVNGPLTDIQSGGAGMNIAAADADTLLLKYASTNTRGVDVGNVYTSLTNPDHKPESLQSYLKRDARELINIVNDTKWNSSEFGPSANQSTVSEQGPEFTESFHFDKSSKDFLSLAQGIGAETKTEMETIHEINIFHSEQGLQEASNAKQKWNNMRQKEIDLKQKICSLPKLSSLSPRTTKRIARLPRPNDHDLRVLNQLSKDYVTNTNLDVSLKRSELYRNLERGRGRLLTFASGDGEFLNQHEQEEADIAERGYIKSANKKRRKESSLSEDGKNSDSTTSNEAPPLETEAIPATGDTQGDPSGKFWEQMKAEETSIDIKSPAQSLRRKLNDSIMMHHNLGDIIVDKMRRDRLDLPIEFLRALGRFDYIKERACIAIVFLLKRVLQRTERLALQHWARVIDFLKVEHLHNAATDITRIARGYLACKETKERRHQKRIQDDAEMERNRTHAEKCRFAAIGMQRIIRGYRCRGFASRARRRKNAATRIQTVIRRIQAKVLVESIIAENILLFESASTIQRSWRCFRARVLYGLKRRIRRVEMGVKWEREKREQVRLQFERKGAAILISRWWRMLKVRMQFLRYRKLNKGRRALRIQCAFRCYRARVALAARAADHKAWLNRRDNAAAKIQSIYRRNKAIEHVQELRDAFDKQRKEREQRIQDAHQDKIKEITFMGKTQKVNMTQIHKRLFSAKKIIRSAVGIQKNLEIKACIRMQAVFRGNRTRKRLAQARMEHHLKLRRELKLARQAATLRVQTRWRANVQRRIFLRRKRRLAATLIQKTWRAMKGRCRAMEYLQSTFSARDIQRVWRGTLGRRIAFGHKSQRKRLGACAMKIQNIARQFLARAKFDRTRERNRYLEEMGLMGKEEFRVCRSYHRDKLILKSFSSRSSKKKGVEQKDPTGVAWTLFQELASGGRKGAHGASEGGESDLKKVEIRVSNTVIARLCNDSQIVDERRIKRATIGTLFAKAKSKQNDKLNFAEFHYLMKLLAIARYPKVELIRQHAGEEAQLIKLCCDHLFGGDNPKKHRRQLRTKMLRRMAKVLDKECDAELAHYVTLMQAVSRGVACRHRFAKLLANHHLHEERQRLERAAMLIEAHLRKVFARAGAEKLASKTIQKFVDPVTKEAYYYNPKTGVTSWDKPDILGKGDVQDPQVLPDKNVEFVVICSNCDKAVAESFCFPCGDGYCNDCFGTLHRKGKKRYHAQTEIPRCHICKYQAATRRFKGALIAPRKTIHSKGKKEKEPKYQFCDSCYEHRRNVVLHECKSAIPRRKPPPAADWVVQPCAECEQRACRWKCLDCDDFYCTRCFSHVHARGARASHKYTMLSYYTVEMEAQRMRQLRERRQKKLAEMREKEMKMRSSNAREKVARWGQARFRGNKGREYGIPFLKAGRAEMRRMYRVTKADDKIRATVKYKLKDLIGASPILESDDLETRARKERAFMHDPKANIQHRLAEAVVFKIPPHLVGKKLPGNILAREGEIETETTVDLRDYLKRGDRIRVDYGIFTIPIEGGFRAPIDGYDDLEDIDPDTHLVKDDPPRFTSMFLPLDRPWPWPTEDSTAMEIFKLKPLRPKDPAVTKIGKAMEAVSHFFSDKSLTNQLRLAGKGHVERIAGNAMDGLAKKTGWKYGKKASECLRMYSRYNMQRAVVTRRTIDPWVLEKRKWSATFDESEGREYFTNRETNEVTWKKPECLMNIEELKVFRAEQAAEKAREDEIAAQKADMEWKKKQREMAKSARGRGKRGRGRGRR